MKFSSESEDLAGAYKMPPRPHGCPMSRPLALRKPHWETPSPRPAALPPGPGTKGTPIPAPGRIGKRGFPDSRFPIPGPGPARPAELGIGDSLPVSRPSPFPGQIGNQGDFRV